MTKFLRAVASLLFVVVAFSALADWTTVQKEFLDAKSHDEAVHKVQQSKEMPSDALHELFSDYESATTKAAKDQTYDSIKQLIASNAMSEQFKTAKGAEETAKKIKKDPVYATQREAKNSNWLQKLGERFRKLFDRDVAEPSVPNVPAMPWLGTVILGLFYLVCAAIVALVIYLLTKIPWSWTKSGRARKAKRGGMLEEGEELLTEDEYLLDADKLIAEGRYREACRALYLASLLRIDKARIARFEPTQTNWEHLRRIETSPIRPENLQFRPVTKEFDHAWYGYRAKYLDDVMIFRETYLVIKSLTETMV